MIIKNLLTYLLTYLLVYCCLSGLVDPATHLRSLWQRRRRTSTAWPSMQRWCQGTCTYVTSNTAVIVINTRHSPATDAFAIHFWHTPPVMQLRESQPFHEELETSISFLISTVMHLEPFCVVTQHCQHVHSYSSGDFNLLIILRRKKQKYILTGAAHLATAGIFFLCALQMFV